MTFYLAISIRFEGLRKVGKKHYFRTFWNLFWIKKLPWKMLIIKYRKNKQKEELKSRKSVNTDKDLPRSI